MVLIGSAGSYLYKNNFGKSVLTLNPRWWSAPAASGARNFLLAAAPDRWLRPNGMLRLAYHKVRESKRWCGKRMRAWTSSPSWERGYGLVDLVVGRFSREFALNSQDLVLKLNKSFYLDILKHLVGGKRLWNLHTVKRTKLKNIMS